MSRGDAPGRVYGTLSPGRSSVMIRKFLITYEVLHALGGKKISSHLLLESLILVYLVEDQGAPKS